MAQRFNIPEIGTKIVLAENWTFPLHHEYRNETLFEILGVQYSHSWRNRPGPVEVTLPKGTILTVDRVYIRKGAKDFSSLTFLIPKRKTERKRSTRTATEYRGASMTEVLTSMRTREPLPPPPPPRTFTYDYTIPSRPVRFWAKLADVNRMVFDIVEVG